VKPYNPLDKKNLAESIVRELLLRDAVQLDKLESFPGAGVYVIYYAGDFEPYATIRNDAELNVFEKPIYVGKAIPAGGRIGGFELDAAPGFVLYNRLKEHAESVKQVENLDVKDFYCRHLVIEDIWIPLAESLLISTFIPVWNVAVSGFGNHDPGNGRYQQKRSYWDEIHHGRAWAMRCQPSSLTQEQIYDNIKTHLVLPADQIEA
jgi:hypothetical protein